MQTGRKRDATLDARILGATLEVLGEVGAVGFTMELVATRAGAGKGAIYRRWPSKTELILDAVAYMRNQTLNRVPLPDTGTLRGDLLALFKPLSKKETERTMKTLAGVASLLTQDSQLAGAADAFFIEPWAQVHLGLMKRAIARGEIPAHADVETLSQLLPSMAAYRSVVQRKTFDREFLVTMVDKVILPALRHPPKD